MKVLFVSANTMIQPYPAYPIGLDYVRNAISPPHDVKNVDMNELKGSEALAAVLDDYDPDLVGISIRNIDNADDTHTESLYREDQGHHRCGPSPFNRLDRSGREWFHHSSRRVHGKTRCRFWRYR